MPRAPTTANVDNTKIIPQWPTVNTHTDDTVKFKSIQYGLDYDDVVETCRRFAALIYHLAFVSEDRPINYELDSCLRNSDISYKDLDLKDGKIIGFKMKTVEVKWPTDKWFKDTNYSLITKLSPLEDVLSERAGEVATFKYNFGGSDRRGTYFKYRSDVDLLRSLLAIYRRFNTRMYNFACSLYKLGGFKLAE